MNVNVRNLKRNSDSYTISVKEASKKSEIPMGLSSITQNNKQTQGEGSGKNEPSAKDIGEGEVADTEDNNNEGSDFETAIAATEYGKYNWFLLFVALWGYMSLMYSTTTMSLIVPSAECDLNLSNFDKGMLNSAVYIGMIWTAFLWGFLSDSFGRRNILIIEFALDSVFSVLLGFAQNFTFLLVSKFFSGVVNSSTGPILLAFLAENHAATNRASITIGTGIFTALANIVLPSWLIIPGSTDVTLLDGYISMANWRIFLFVSATPSIIALIVIFFIDESPKFLMSQNRNEEALKVFKKIYSWNTGKPEDMYPVKYLKKDDVHSKNGQKKETTHIKRVIYDGWKQMTTIFQRPYLWLIVLPCVIQFFTFLGTSTIRLWSPQLFSAAIEKEILLENAPNVTTICEILTIDTRETVVEQTKSCSEKSVDEKVYFDSMIMGMVTGIGYFISCYIVKILDRKWLMISAYSFSIMCCFVLYWSTSSNRMLGVISVFVAVLSSAISALLSVLIDIFPTFLRTTAVSLCLTFGRMGAMVGSMIFPILLDWNCTSPFVMLAVILVLTAGLTFMLPETKEKHLE